jgi:hypothetical protein
LLHCNIYIKERVFNSLTGVQKPLHCGKPVWQIKNKETGRPDRPAFSAIERLALIYPWRGPRLTVERRISGAEAMMANPPRAKANATANILIVSKRSD